MVEEGTWAWIEIADSRLFPQPLPTDVVASVFANRDIYLILANYGKTPLEVTTADTWLVNLDDGSAPGKTWQLPARTMRVLHRV